MLAAVLLLATAAMGCNVALPGRPTPREPLDANWEKHMLEGRGVQMWLDEQLQPTQVQEGGSAESLASFRSREEPRSYLYAFTDPYGIMVLRRVDGYWRNGGWILTGGPLVRANDGQSAVELYGEAIIRRPIHIPDGIFHLDPPEETGYEFFLLRRQGTTPAVILRRWIVQPDEVVPDQEGYPRVPG